MKIIHDAIDIYQDLCEAAVYGIRNRRGLTLYLEERHLSELRIVKDVAGYLSFGQNIEDILLRIGNEEVIKDTQTHGWNLTLRRESIGKILREGSCGFTVVYKGASYRINLVLFRDELDEVSKKERNELKCLIDQALVEV